ncbi:uncharacterized protein LOC111893187 [Lactuca sativa]|uniref:uncharacterized protein LOC111893187 n=1 Tax=Lactuca sativa TaxID=4236 RepID=UPI000CD8B0FA|nr:uncharacterized protein LOC111893187 [Lactuca sativa]
MAGEKGDGSKKPEGGETIDTNSPYYIHASDYPKQMQVNDVLNDNNYNEWKQKMRNFLLAKNKMGLVDGSIEKPEVSSPMHTAWIRADAMIKGWLTTAMEKDIRTSVRYANTSSEIWQDLEERFEKEGAPRAYELKQLLNVTRQDGNSVSNYYTKLKSIWDELQMVLPSPRCTCEGCDCGIEKKLNELREKERTYEFLMGLDDEFSVIRTQVLAMKPTPPIGTVYHLLAEDEQQRALSGGTKRSSTESSAFQENFNQQRGQQQPTNKTTVQTTGKSTQKFAKSESDKKVRCSFCQHEGHNKKGCFKIIGYPDWWPGNKEKPKVAYVKLGSSPIPGLTDKQYHLFVEHFKEGLDMTNNNKQPMENMAGRNDIFYGWIVDSGATKHMTHILDFLFNKTQNSKNSPVVIPNGDKVSVMGEDEHTLPGGVNIKGVLFELGTKHLIGAGNRSGGLYRMGVTKVKTSKALMSNFEVWHRRLGHPSSKKISSLNFIDVTKEK